MVYLKGLNLSTLMGVGAALDNECDCQSRSRGVCQRGVLLMPTGGVTATV